MKLKKNSRLERQIGPMLEPGPCEMGVCEGEYAPYTRYAPSGQKVSVCCACRDIYDAEARRSSPEGADGCCWFCGTRAGSNEDCEYVYEYVYGCDCRQ